MISVILLIFTIVLIAIGGICGFHRGILKEGVRVALWAILFAGSLFVIPQFTDSLLLFIAGKLNIETANMEQLVEMCLSKVDILKNETALVLPLAELVRSLAVPVMTIVFFWATGLVSFVLYLIISLFMKKAAEKQKLILKAAGAVLGIMMFLLAGSITVFPLAAVCDAVKEGDYDLTLQNEFNEVTLVTDTYEGSAVSKLYRYTGTETLGKAVHNTAIFMVVEKENNIWTELPSVIRLGNEGLKIYNLLSDNVMNELSMQKQVPQVLEAFFDLKFVSDENQIHLLKNMKTTLENSLGDSGASEFLGWLEVHNRNQIVNDMSVYGKIYDILKQDGSLDALLEGNSIPHLKEETVNAVMNALYELSNADVVVPKALKLLYMSALNNADIPLELPDIEWTEETKAEFEEIVSVVYEVSEIPENKDNITEEEKEEIIETLQDLKDNSIITEELLEELINSYGQ